MTSGGFRLHYIRWGVRGASLLLLHSMGMDAHGFDIFSRAVADEYRVLALDLLDHGDSEKPTRPVGLGEHAEVVRGAYTQLGFSPNTLIGHSIGGIIGMVLAAKYLEDLEGLVLVDIAPFKMDRPRAPRPAPPESFADEEEARAYIRQRYPRMTYEAVENRLKHAFKRSPDGRFRLKGVGGALRGGLSVDLWQFVEQIRTPTLLLIGEESTLVTPDTSERMRSLIPDFKVVTVEGATHMVPQDKPRAFEREVRAFLKQAS